MSFRGVFFALSKTTNRRPAFVTLPAASIGASVSAHQAVRMPTRDPPSLGALMAEAQRVMVALDGRTQRDGTKATAKVVSEGSCVCARLREYQNTVKMTASEIGLPDLLYQRDC